MEFFPKCNSWWVGEGRSSIRHQRVSAEISSKLKIESTMFSEKVSTQCKGQTNSKVTFNILSLYIQDLILNMVIKSMWKA